jgi:hypothetical protein
MHSAQQQQQQQQQSSSRAQSHLPAGTAECGHVPRLTHAHSQTRPHLCSMVLLTRTAPMGCLSGPTAGGRWLMFSRPAAATFAAGAWRQRQGWGMHCGTTPTACVLVLLLLLPATPPHAHAPVSIQPLKHCSSCATSLLWCVHTRSCFKRATCWGVHWRGGGHAAQRRAVRCQHARTSRALWPGCSHGSLPLLLPWPRCSRRGATQQANAQLAVALAQAAARRRTSNASSAAHPTDAAGASAHTHTAWWLQRAVDDGGMQRRPRQPLSSGVRAAAPAPACEDAWTSL